MLRLNSYVHVNRPGSSVIGEIEVYIPSIGLTLRRIKECKKGERRWFNWSCYCEDDGQTKQFLPHAEFDPKERKEKLFAALRIEVDKFLKEEEVRETQRLRKGMEKERANPEKVDVNAMPPWASQYFKPDFDTDSEVPS